jgi:hypothetical protein
MTMTQPTLQSNGPVSVTSTKTITGDIVVTSEMDEAALFLLQLRNPSHRKDASPPTDEGFAVIPEGLYIIIGVTPHRRPPSERIPAEKDSATPWTPRQVRHLTSGSKATKVGPDASQDWPAYC